MTLDKRIKEIKKRMEKATPGPWSTDDSCTIICSKDFEEIAVCNDREYFSTPYVNNICEANARFIAHSRSDIEFLVKALEIAKTQLKTVIHRGHCPAIGDYHIPNWLVVECENSLKEIEELAK